MTAHAPFESIDHLRRRAFTAGVVASCASALGWALDPGAFYSSWLAAFLFWTALGTGCLALSSLHQLVHGRWGLATSRLFEAGAGTLPLNAVMFLPLLPGLSKLYPWFGHSPGSAPRLQFRDAWLSEPAFLARTGAYFLIWFALAFALNWQSLKRDGAPSDRVTQRLRRLAAAGLVVYGLTMTFASIDWGMSLEPDWFSTIYGAMVIVGGILGALAFAITILTRLADQPEVDRVASSQVYNDLGNLLLAFVILWAYLSFSQFLIVWSGDTTTEISWYLKRTRNGWNLVAAVLIVLHFALPLLLLLSKARKRNSRTLSRVACFLLCISYVNVLWLIVPSVRGGYSIGTTGVTLPAFHWMDVVAPIALGGFWIAWFCSQLKRAPLVPMHDPAWDAIESVNRETVHAAG